MSLFCFVVIYLCVFFFFKQKTAYEMRISDWSSDVCSSDLAASGTSALCGRCVVAPFRPAALPPTPVGTEQSVAVIPYAKEQGQIGRASCRERVCQYV